MFWSKRKSPKIQRVERLRKPPHHHRPFVLGGSLPLPPVIDFGRPLDMPAPQEGLGDPMLDLASADAAFHSMQVNAGWEILNGERPIETAGDAANVWTAQGFNNASPYEPTILTSTPAMHPDPMQQGALPPELMQQELPLLPDPFGPPIGG